MSAPTLVESDCWFQTITQGEEGTLLCFPYAGSGAAIFGAWRAQMFSGPSLVAASLPGREGRLRETPFEDLAELAGVFADQIESNPNLRTPLFLLGCSVGALLAFEVARRLKHRGIPADYLIVAAARAPQTIRRGQGVHKLPDDRFINKMQKKYAAIPPQILADQTMRQMLLPMLRADIKMYETYLYEPGPKLSCPILALGGTEDKNVPARTLFAWREHTNSFRQRMFPGDHYFVKQCKESVLQTIRRKIA